MNEFQPAALHRFGAVCVRLSVELGRTEMPLRDVLMLGEGSTVTLDRLTDELLDVTANGRVIARGEVVADKGRFGLRIVCLVGEDGKDVPRTGDAAAPAAEAALARENGDSAASAPPPTEPAAPPPPPPLGDPLGAMLDDIL